MPEPTNQYDRIMQAVGSVYAERGWPEDVRALEAMSDAVEGLLAAEVARAEQAETAIARVRVATDNLCYEPHPEHDHVCPDEVRATILDALAEPQEGP